MNEKETLSARSLGAEVRIDVSLPRRKYRVVGGCFIAQIFEGMFSAVSQPILAIRGSFRLFYHLEYVHIVFHLDFSVTISQMFGYFFGLSQAFGELAKI